MKRSDGPWKVHPYHQNPVAIPEAEEPIEASITLSETLLDRVFDAAENFYQAMGCPPQQARIGIDVYHELLDELYRLEACACINPQVPKIYKDIITVATPVGVVIVKLDFRVNSSEIVMEKSNGTAVYTTT